MSTKYGRSPLGVATETDRIRPTRKRLTGDWNHPAAFNVRHERQGMMSTTEEKC